MERLTYRRERVYDPVLRLIHAWNGLLIVLLIVSGQVAGVLEYAWPAAGVARLHLWLGYGLVLGLVARVLWGRVGPTHARWSALWHPELWRQALAKREFFTPPESAGHHPLASAAYLATYLLLGVMAATGLALAAIDQNTGPLYAWLGHDVFSKATYRTPHEWLQYFFIGFVVAHFAALILHERRHGVPVAQAMVSGYQYEKETP
jgi:cytochrome b